MKHFKYKKIHFVVLQNYIVTQGNHFFIICNMLNAMLQIILSQGKVTSEETPAKLAHYLQNQSWFGIVLISLIINQQIQ